MLSDNEFFNGETSGYKWIGITVVSAGKLWYLVAALYSVDVV